MKRPQFVEIRERCFVIIALSYEEERTEESRRYDRLMEHVVYTALQQC